jgi:hypothetical protein
MRRVGKLVQACESVSPHEIKANGGLTKSHPLINSLKLAAMVGSA